MGKLLQGSKEVNSSVWGIKGKSFAKPALPRLMRKGIMEGSSCQRTQPCDLHKAPYLNAPKRMLRVAFFPR